MRPFRFFFTLILGLGLFFLAAKMLIGLLFFFGALALLGGMWRAFHFHRFAHHRFTSEWPRGPEPLLPLRRVYSPQDELVPEHDPEIDWLTSRRRITVE